MEAIGCMGTLLYRRFSIPFHYTFSLCLAWHGNQHYEISAGSTPYKRRGMLTLDVRKIIEENKQIQPQMSHHTWHFTTSCIRHAWAIVRRFSHSDSSGHAICYIAWLTQKQTVGPWPVITSLITFIKLHVAFGPAADTQGAGVHSRTLKVSTVPHTSRPI